MDRFTKAALVIVGAIVVLGAILVLSSAPVVQAQKGRLPERAPAPRTVNIDRVVDSTFRVVCYVNLDSGAISCVR